MSAKLKEYKISGEQYIYLFHHTRRLKKEAEDIAVGKAIGKLTDPGILTRKHYLAIKVAVEILQPIKINAKDMVVLELKPSTARLFKQNAEDHLKVIVENIEPEVKRRLTKFKDVKDKFDTYKKQGEQLEQTKQMLKDIVGVFS